MAVQITLDQMGQPPGIPGRARQDFVTGVAALCTAVGGPFIQYRWEVVSKPIDILVPVRSAAIFSTSTASTSLLQPIDLAGTYLLRCTVNSGNGLGADEGDVAETDFYAGPALATDVRRLPRRWPAFAEKRSHNVPDAIDPAGNTEGWAREQLMWRQIYAISMDWASGLVRNDGFITALVRGFGVSVTYIAPGRVQVTFDTPMLDKHYLVVVGVDDFGQFAPAPPAAVQVVAKLTTGFEVNTFDILGAALADGIPFSFVVKLGLLPAVT